MSDSMSNYMESGVLNLVLRANTNSFAAPANVSVSLLANHDTYWGLDAKNGETMPEVANAGSYARVTLGAPANASWNEVNANGATSNASVVTFPTATAHWGMVSGVALVTSATHGAGKILFHGALTTARDISSGDTFKFNAGDLDITLT